MQKKFKTKFPVARIKKIMRTDEDVGKVAQVTPVLISKALELFMQSLVDETCNETRTRNAKKMSASHLKKTIMQTEKFDFLVDIVSKVPDPVEGDGVEEGPKRKGRGPGKKKTKSVKVEESTESSPSAPAFTYACVDEAQQDAA